MFWIGGRKVWKECSQRWDWWSMVWTCYNPAFADASPVDWSARFCSGSAMKSFPGFPFFFLVGALVRDLGDQS